MKNLFNSIKKIHVIFLFFTIIVCSFNQIFAQINIKEYEEDKEIEKIVDVLKDKNLKINIRQRAVYALGRLKDVRAIDPLISALKDNRLKKPSIWALGKIKDEKSVEALVFVLTDSSSFGREEAAKALDSLNWKPTTDQEKVYYLVSKRDWKACLRLGNLAIEPLVFTLIDGENNARIKASETLDSLGWKPNESNKKAYDSAKALKTEMMVYRETIVMKETKLLQEYKTNLQKLHEDHEANDSSFTEKEFAILEKRFTQDINREMKEIEAFRLDLSKISLKITKAGKRTYLGKEGDGKDIIAFEVQRNPNTKQVQKGIWRNAWTGKPTKELVWDGLIGNFYRYNSKGEKYLFAKYYFFDYRGQLKRIDFVEPDGGLKERIIWGGHDMIWGHGSKISTYVGQDKWIDWPKDIGWASERLKFIEAKLITNKRSYLR